MAILSFYIVSSPFSRSTGRKYLDRSHRVFILQYNILTTKRPKEYDETLFSQRTFTIKNRNASEPDFYLKRDRISCPSY